MSLDETSVETRTRAVLRGERLGAAEFKELERISERAPRKRCACWLPDCHSAALNPWQAGGVSSDPTRDPRGAVRYAIESSISQTPAEEGQEGNAWLAGRNHRVLRP